MFITFSLEKLTEIILDLESASLAKYQGCWDESLQM